MLFPQVACGRSHTLALSSDGNRLYTWGDGEFGKLGLGSTTSKPTPNIIDSLRNVGLKKIACGTTFSVALGNNGLVYTFGHGKWLDCLNISYLLRNFVRLFHHRLSGKQSLTYLQLETSGESFSFLANEKPS